jgi:hypothetical protein
MLFDPEFKCFLTPELKGVVNPIDINEFLEDDMNITDVLLTPKPQMFLS